MQKDNNLARKEAPRCQKVLKDNQMIMNGLFYSMMGTIRGSILLSGYMRCNQEQMYFVFLHPSTVTQPCDRGVNVELKTQASRNRISVCRALVPAYQDVMHFDAVTNSWMQTAIFPLELDIIRKLGECQLAPKPYHLSSRFSYSGCLFTDPSFLKRWKQDIAMKAEARKQIETQQDQTNSNELNIEKETEKEIENQKDIEIKQRTVDEDLIEVEEDSEEDEDYSKMMEIEEDNQLSYITFNALKGKDDNSLQSEEKQNYEIENKLDQFRWQHAFQLQ
ncbi:MAG: hypothetical protein EZS28_003328 [Streblomastix strix]|uniref:Uncharacterized protein n=1 Tax=Streblomastix strix TaxID=222440 RepID=A0A5J4X1Q4_9EUKA|nr:MAG: hypothetical protein EZS28_003328 [Streblomastix strix]